MKKLLAWFRNELPMKEQMAAEVTFLLIVAFIFLSLSGIRCSVSIHSSSQESSK